MAIARSQFVEVTGNGVSSVSAVFAAAISSGSLISVMAGYFSVGGGGIFTTVTDNVNNAGFVQRLFSTMSNGADTNAHLTHHDKLNISSGRAGASTYRISYNLDAPANPSFCAVEYTGGPFTFGSTISANGTSTGPAGGALSGSSTPLLFVSGAVHNSTSVFRSTGINGSTYITTVDPTNANQILNVVESIGNSSLQQNPGHAMTSSTRWLAGTIVYMGLGEVGGGADYYGGVGFPLMGLQ